MIDEVSGEVENRLRASLAEGVDCSGLVEELLLIRQMPEGERLMAQIAEPLLRKHHVTQWVPVRGGLTMLLDSRDLVQRTIMVSGHWEPVITGVLEALLEPGDSFIDCGAHVGYFTLRGLELVGESGFVRAVEASPVTVQFLRMNLQRNGFPASIGIHAALWDEEAEVGVWEGPHVNRGVSRAVPLSGGPAIPVRGAPLDQLVPDAPSGRPLVVKVDIEGGEVRAARGIVATLAKAEDAALIIEVNPDADPGWLFELARSGGFDIYGLPNSYSAEFRYSPVRVEVQPITAGDVGQTDFLLVRGAMRRRLLPK